ncbi:MAG: PilZ domain-containing protein [Terriglobia bacterium]
MLTNDHDARRVKRVVFTTRAALGTGSTEGARIVDAATIDLSEAGVRLRLSGQVEPGQIVEVFLGKHPERCRVVWTNPTPARQELIAGLEFIRPLPDAP